ncbi:PREDICTED: sodium/potassium-transporting ATPase subunit beta-like [Priapulus caudatus]|uniref:Sodium/potassium-transporting ATPase subunit beta-like n=1 Tax=Priapulus caudatus TaxID=37621 RepID=A0ABM1E3C8_PRICU|nr:PREDICTED: sodium/potassium-transporting ATPase subunit beta-like [Priapulus caudatus]
MGSEEKCAAPSRLTFLYNPATGEVIGRTGKSWALITIFFAIFYLCLTGFFAINLAVFEATLNDYTPRYYGKHSILGGNPGMGWEPQVDIEKTLVWFRSQKAYAHTYKPYVDELYRFLRPYDEDKQKGEHIFNCEGRPAPTNRVCRFDVKKMIGNEVCKLHLDDFGYNVGKPCIVLTLNKIYNWTAELYEDTSDPGLKDAPQEMKDNRFRNDYIPISCEGVYAADKEYIGKISYYPKYGFPAYFYPYTNTPGYLQPFVAIQLENPQKKTLINIECKAWAKNIEHTRQTHRGMASFEIMID